VVVFKKFFKFGFRSIVGICKGTITFMQLLTHDGKGIVAS
jgi:hypothetical protein